MEVSELIDRLAQARRMHPNCRVMINNGDVDAVEILEVRTFQVQIGGERFIGLRSTFDDVESLRQECAEFEKTIARQSTWLNDKDEEIKKLTRLIEAMRGGGTDVGVGEA